MEQWKRAALLIYPLFCNYEIALTLATLRMFDVEIVTFAKDRNPLPCEEGLILVADSTRMSSILGPLIACCSRASVETRTLCCGTTRMWIF